MENAYKTPYEKYVRDSIDAEKQNLDNLYNEFARTNTLNKQVIKQKIDRAIQNIELLKKELEKYGFSLTWLREPSKERDNKASHLEKIQEEKPAASPTPTRPVPPSARPAVGTPIGRPQVGSPIGAKPQVSTLVGTAPRVGTPVAPTSMRPQVGTPVGAKPQIGTPVGTASQTETQQTATTQPQAGARPQVGIPIAQRPRIGTSIKSESKQEEKKDENSSS
ncbi:MAG: hypothetical protein JRN20_02270 [Nitrososphaerota archaeon]|nr:hypothetical protein [Nitrososphaerota archaeon]MDG6922888.1 hypothetical protein [Nitrososphaerota archaeon]